MDQEKWNSYYIPGTDTFINKLGIINKNELLQTEIDISFEKIVELYENPIEGNFDKEHLKTIHRTIFGDIYPWAGEFRIVSMIKGDFSYYVEPDLIEDNLDKTLKSMNEEIHGCHGQYSYAMFLADYYKQIYMIHPFREGNSRTLREFLREFVLKYIDGYYLDWSKIDKDKIYEAVFSSGFINNGTLEMEFYKALVSSKELEGESR